MICFQNANASRRNLTVASERFTSQRGHHDETTGRREQRRAQGWLQAVAAQQRREPRSCPAKCRSYPLRPGKVGECGRRVSTYLQGRGDGGTGAGHGAQLQIFDAGSHEERESHIGRAGSRADGVEPGGERGGGEEDALRVCAQKNGPPHRVARQLQGGGRQKVGRDVGDAIDSGFILDALNRS